MASTLALTPLELPGWLEFNSWRTGLRAERFSATPDGGPEIRAVLYVDRRGRIVLPPNNPHTPIVFKSNRQRPSGGTAEWLRAAAPLVAEMRQRGIRNQLYLSPDVQDVRPWSWQGFLVGVSYTYVMDFPFDATTQDWGSRHNSKRAHDLGMTVERVTDLKPLLDCLADTEAHKGFRFGIGARELRVAYGLLGEEALRLYVCFDCQGRPAAAEAVIHAPGAKAVEWVAGMKADHRATGASYLLRPFVFNDLACASATGVDLSGANLASVAAFKSLWGSRLVPSYAVRTYSTRATVRLLTDWLHSRRRSACS